MGIGRGAPISFRSETRVAMHSINLLIKLTFLPQVISKLEGDSDPANRECNCNRSDE